ncbi:MAG: hypothetical protein AB4352_19560 [Hormoscilla sp.]
MSIMLGMAGMAYGAMVAMVAIAAMVASLAIGAWYFHHLWNKMQFLQACIRRDRELMNRCFCQLHDRPLQTLAFLIRETDRNPMSAQLLREYLCQVYKEVAEGIEYLGDDRVILPDIGDIKGPR